MKRMSTLSCAANAPAKAMSGGAGVAWCPQPASATSAAAARVRRIAASVALGQGDAREVARLPGHGAEVAGERAATDERHVGEVRQRVGAIRAVRIAEEV